MRSLPATLRLARLLVVVLFSVVIALLTFILKTRSGARMADAVLVAGSAFACSMVLALGLLAAAVGS